MVRSYIWVIYCKHMKTFQTENINILRVLAFVNSSTPAIRSSVTSAISLIANSSVFLYIIETPPLPHLNLPYTSVFKSHTFILLVIHILDSVYGPIYTACAHMKHEALAEGLISMR